MVFYSILLIYIFYKEKNILCYIKYFDFVALPFAFFTIKHYYWPTFGYYINYNTITFEGIKLAIKQLPQGIWYTFTYPIKQSVPFYLEVFVLLILVTLILIDRFLFKNKDSFSNNNRDYETRNILLGIFFLIVAIFPYITIFSIVFFSGLNFNSFDTRHLLLTPLGIAWTTYFLFRLIFRNRKVFITALLIIILLNMIQWNKTYLMYECYWYKQNALICLIRDEQYIKDNDTFTFIDKDKTIFYSSIYNFYSLAGVLKRAYGDESRLMVRIGEENIMQIIKPCFNKDYLLGDYTGDYTKIDGTIYFESDLTMKDIPALRFYDFVQSTRFETSLREKNSIRVVKHVND